MAGIWAAKSVLHNHIAKPPEFAMLRRSDESPLAHPNVLA
jgi:hypothetical protein